MNSLPVVLIEPDFMVRDSIKSMLIALDYEVRDFPSIAAFFDFAVETNFQFQFLIADDFEWSPDNQVVAQVLERVNPDARVIVMCNGGASFVETTIKKIDCVLLKPFRIGQLHKALSGE